VFNPKKRMENSRREKPNYLKKLEEQILKGKK
jgi:hypothetical protein